MNLGDLYKSLSEAYSSSNLNDLSSDIIALYRSKDIARLRKIHALIYQGDQGDEEQLSRIFSRIIMVYHPDRQEQISRQLKSSFDGGDIEGLKKLDHILDVQMLDLSTVESGAAVDVDFDYEDIFDSSAGGYSFIDDDYRERDEFDPVHDAIMSNDFFTAVKRKVYGSLNVEFPVHLLADMEIIEMSEYEIENLDGVEYCTYARIIDLSSNNLTEVSLLSHLMRLEEVYLQNNQLSYLDGLDDLPYLRVLDISNNMVDDISLLFETDTLEFLNLIGNRIPGWQLEVLSRRGVIIVS